MKNIYCLLIVSFLCIFSLLPAGAQTLSEKDFQVLNYGAQNETYIED